jgi:hypothetical protein
MRNRADTCKKRLKAVRRVVRYSSRTTDEQDSLCCRECHRTSVHRAEEPEQHAGCNVVYLYPAHKGGPRRFPSLRGGKSNLDGCRLGCAAMHIALLDAPKGCKYTYAPLARTPWSPRGPDHRRVENVQRHFELAHLRAGASREHCSQPGCRGPVV